MLQNTFNPPDHICLVNIAIPRVFISLKCQQVHYTLATWEIAFTMSAVVLDFVNIIRQWYLSIVYSLIQIKKTYFL